MIKPPGVTKATGRFSSQARNDRSSQHVRNDFLRRREERSIEVHFASVPGRFRNHKPKLARFRSGNAMDGGGYTGVLAGP